MLLSLINQRDGEMVTPSSLHSSRRSFRIRCTCSNSRSLCSQTWRTLLGCPWFLLNSPSRLGSRYRVLSGRVHPLAPVIAISLGQDNHRSSSNSYRRRTILSSSNYKIQATSLNWIPIQGSKKVGARRQPQRQQSQRIFHPQHGLVVPNTFHPLMLIRLCLLNWRRFLRLGINTREITSIHTRCWSSPGTNWHGIRFWICLRDWRILGRRGRGSWRLGWVCWIRKCRRYRCKRKLRGHLGMRGICKCSNTSRRLREFRRWVPAFLKPGILRSVIGLLIS